MLWGPGAPWALTLGRALPGVKQDLDRLWSEPGRLAPEARPLLIYGLEPSIPGPGSFDLSPASGAGNSRVLIGISQADADQVSIPAPSPCLHERCRWGCGGGLEGDRGCCEFVSAPGPHEQSRGGELIAPKDHPPCRPSQP